MSQKSGAPEPSPQASLPCYFHAEGRGFREGSETFEGEFDFLLEWDDVVAEEAFRSVGGGVQVPEDRLDRPVDRIGWEGDFFIGEAGTPDDGFMTLDGMGVR